MVERARVELASVGERECVFRLTVLRYTTAPNEPLREIRLSLCVVLAKNNVNLGDAFVSEVEGLNLLLGSCERRLRSDGRQTIVRGWLSCTWAIVPQQKAVLPARKWSKTLAADVYPQVRQL